MTPSFSCHPSLPTRVERVIAAERRAFAISTSANRIEAGVLDIAGGCAVYVDLVGRRQYRLRRFRNIDACSPASVGLAPSGPFEVAIVDGTNREVWSAALIEGFGYRHPDAIRLVEEWNEALLATPGLTALIVRAEGEVAASASVFIDG